MDEQSKKRLQLKYRIGQLFLPATPITTSQMFAGRKVQIDALISAISMRGRHAIIFGERGVGKTSLASVLSDILSSIGGTANPIVAPRINCDTMDDFTTIWEKIFRDIEEIDESEDNEEIPEEISPHWVCAKLAALSEEGGIVIIIIDEFDRISAADTPGLFADTIKMLSDHAVSATLILVGVADSVDEIIGEHASIERALAQVSMPRMSPQELQEIVQTRLVEIGFGIEPEALSWIAELSKGLPHYAHLLGLYSTHAAIDQDESVVRSDHVAKAITLSIDNAQESIKSLYHRATMSPKANIYADVLLACALAETDDLGFFAAANVRAPLTTIKGRRYDIPAFARHLNDFCDEKRGPVLQKIGEKHRFRYRFINPLLQPYLILRGYQSGQIKKTKSG